MSVLVDVLIPTFSRPAALAVTLAGLAAQEFTSFRIVVSDQTEDFDAAERGEAKAMLRFLRLRGHVVETHKHLPRRGMAEHRQFLLEQARAPFALLLDDDLFLEPDVIGRMVQVLKHEECGFVGCAPIGLSYLGDVRPHQQWIEFWDGPVRPEKVTPQSPEWQRHKVHSAANILHVQQRLGVSASTQRTYKLAWVGGCVLFDVEKLRACGGFEFWKALPCEHCGEDVLAQLRVMERFGGCGLIPSGVYHMEIPTTIPNRLVNAPETLRPHSDSAAIQGRAG